MKTMISIPMLLLAFLLVASSAYAYVYFVEADEYDLDRSEPEVGGVRWILREDKNDPKVKEASGEKYLECDIAGDDKLALSSLIYPLPSPDKNTQATIWVRVVMPDGGHDSYFFYISNDGGKKWSGQIKGSGGGGDPKWQWKTWNNTVALKKGDDNVLRVAEREQAFFDVICLRDDGATPTDEELAAWKEEQPQKQMAVEPHLKLTTTWASIKKQ